METTKTTKTQVFNLIILDKSGSMDSIRKEAIAGYNETLGSIKAAQLKHYDTQEHYISLAAFCGCGVDMIYDPLHSVPWSRKRSLPASMFQNLLQLRTVLFSQILATQDQPFDLVGRFHVGMLLAFLFLPDTKLDAFRTVVGEPSRSIREGYRVTSDPVFLSQEIGQCLCPEMAGCAEDTHPAVLESRSAFDLSSEPAFSRRFQQFEHTYLLDHSSDPLSECLNLVSEILQQFTIDTGIVTLLEVLCDHLFLACFPLFPCPHAGPPVLHRLVADLPAF